jgi:hypothetical protein
MQHPAIHLLKPLKRTTEVTAIQPVLNNKNNKNYMVQDWKSKGSRKYQRACCKSNDQCVQNCHEQKPSPWLPIFWDISRPLPYTNQQARSHQILFTPIQAII